MLLKRFSVVLALLLGAGWSSARAGIYADDMARCLVDSSSTQDKTTLVRWIYVALSQNPSISSLSKVTSADIEKSNAEVGALFMRLLTESCADKTKKAIQYEGNAAMQTSFATLGQVAAAQLFASPEVNTVLEGLKKYVDPKKLEALKSGTP
ncbi:MAG TPA: hypothetical protein VMI92_02065 [Steroidobacteraceae bacterium]|nr:hypothetical protein [Steroidobacteraceae bacterium]